MSERKCRHSRASGNSAAQKSLDPRFRGDDIGPFCNRFLGCPFDRCFGGLLWVRALETSPLASAEHQSARRACRDAAGLRGALPRVVSIEAVRTAGLRGEAVLRSEIASVGPSGLHPDLQPQQVRKQPLPMLRAVLGQAGEFAMRQLKGSLPKLRGLAGRFVATIRGGHEA